MYDRLGFLVMQKGGFVTEGQSRDADVFFMDKLMSVQCSGNIRDLILGCKTVQKFLRHDGAPFYFNGSTLGFCQSQDDRQP